MNQGPIGRSKHTLAQTGPFCGFVPGTCQAQPHRQSHRLKMAGKCEKMEGTLPFSRRQPPQAPSDTQSKLARPTPSGGRLRRIRPWGSTGARPAVRQRQHRARPPPTPPVRPPMAPIPYVASSAAPPTRLVLSIRDLPLAHVCVFLRLQGATTGGRKRKAAAAPRKPRKAQVRVRVRGFVFNCSPHSSQLAFS